MKSLMTKMHKGQKGLTLIELLIVVAILGIIAAVVIPNLGAFMVTGRVSAANTELENVKTASLAYYAEYEAWPQTTADENFQRYVAGNLSAVYTFDAAEEEAPNIFGWVVAAEPIGDAYQGITFAFDPPGGLGESGGHGAWRRA